MPSVEGAFLSDLRSLAEALGVQTSFRDGFGRNVDVQAETLVRVCAALGAELDSAAGARAALAAHRSAQAKELVSPVVVAWDGRLAEVTVDAPGPLHAELRLEDGGLAEVVVEGGTVRPPHPLPPGYHRLTLEVGARSASCTVISAPLFAWPGDPTQREHPPRSWGVGGHLAAFRSGRSRSVGDLQDLATLCSWVADEGGDVVTVLPLLPTFNQAPPEPSPYSPVSRLFWSELVLDLGRDNVPTPPPDVLDVIRADAEVRRALADATPPRATDLDDELIRYARFRGAQARHGRNWRDWPAHARDGALTPADIDGDEERYHLVAQTRVRAQLKKLSEMLRADGIRLGLDLAVGAHSDGYDAWSRQALFANGISVGAPPDPGFAGGQDWGFAPVLPSVSRLEGHRYLADAIAHQAALAGVLRVDHVMALSRLYWIPHSAALHEGTYVAYPEEELFAVLTLESHRNECEIVGENLGTVPRSIGEALPRHGISGMYLAQFASCGGKPALPTHADVALVGTHDTPTFAGWLAGADIEERVRMGLLAADAASTEHQGRMEAAEGLASLLGEPADEPAALYAALLAWLAGSDSPLVIPWIEDLWLEPEQVNLPGTRSSDRPNWQRPMARLLDDIIEDERILELLRLLNDERAAL